MIIVAGWMDVAPEMRDSHLTRLVTRVMSVRDEPGCLSYGFCPDPITPGRLQMFECWNTSEDFDAHRERSRTNPSTERPSPILASDFSIYEVSSKTAMPFGGR